MFNTEIKIREIGIFFLKNSGKSAKVVKNLEMEGVLYELLEKFEQILADSECEE